MSLAYIGPIVVEHGNPSFGFESDGSLFRSGSIAGLATWDQAKQLSELMANPGRRSFVGGRAGILEIVWFDDPLLDDFNGWCLLEGVSLAPSQEHSLDDYTAPFSASVCFLGQREPVVVHSYRPLTNDFGIEGQGVWASPYRIEEAPGQMAVVTSDGTIVAREYDEVV